MALEVVMKTHGTLAVMEVKGQISGTEVETFSTAVQKALAQNHPRVILDISGTSFVDSQGLGKIVSFNAMMKKNGHELIILNSNTDPETFMAGLFAMTNLDKVMKVVSSLEGL